LIFRQREHSQEIRGLSGSAGDSTIVGSGGHHLIPVIAAQPGQCVPYPPPQLQHGMLSPAVPMSKGFVTDIRKSLRSETPKGAN
jgi:hypothetical protein